MFCALTSNPSRSVSCFCSVSCINSCNTCFQNIMTKKPPSERRFGILSNCSHVFCLSCIRKWRSAKQFENKTIRFVVRMSTSSAVQYEDSHYIACTQQLETLLIKKMFLRFRACPECRVKSDFVTPSKYWVEDPADKDKLICGYKSNLE